ncbi:AC5 [Macroptilium common mosaic virus]|uniref:AC5 n=1 Tax=Macroptilium common mosaic virus TaxID=1904881 RepID=A0A1D8GV29_9GEMI|nr:AC5 [Macroptilium common mosaic virus]AOT83374.1 AC5 [Macroptilium common mosaic virus]
MILVLPCFLMIVHNIIIHLPKTLNQCLLVARILSTSDFGIKFMHHLETITKIVLNSSSTGLIVKHVEHLAKVHGSTIGSTVSDQPKHHTIGMVLQLDVLVHPYLT